MKRMTNVFIPPGLGTFLLLILFFPCPCTAGDRGPGHQMLVFPMPWGLSPPAMEISFDGRGNPDDPVVIFPAGAGHRPVTRLQDYMLKYVTIAAPVSGREMFDTAVTGVTGNASEKISFEIQAGLPDLSGALFIVFQL